MTWRELLRGGRSNGIGRARAQNVQPQSCTGAPVDTRELDPQQNLGFGGGTATYSRFTVFPSVEAIETARSALVTSMTVPRKKTVSFSMLK